MNINGVEIYLGERVDDLHRNGYQIIQNPAFFCFGSDAVLLSGFTKVRKNETVLDLGTGTGIIPILLAAKTAGRHFTGLEIQVPCAAMAQRSVALNGLLEKVQIDHGDIRAWRDIYKPSSFDVVTSNPPYMAAGGGVYNQDAPNAIARHEILCGLEDVVSAAAGVLKPGGRFYLVHRPARLVEIINTMTAYGLQPKTLQMVQPRLSKAPTMVLLEGVRGGRLHLKVLPALVIYEEDERYTKEAYQIYYE